MGIVLARGQALMIKQHHKPCHHSGRLWFSLLIAILIASANLILTPSAFAQTEEDPTVTAAEKSAKAMEKACQQSADQLTKTIVSEQMNEQSRLVQEITERIAKSKFQFFGCLLLTLVAYLVSLIGAIWLLVVAFKKSVVWGLVSIFVPFGGVVFVFCNWEPSRTPFLISFVALLAVVLGLAGSMSIFQGLSIFQGMPLPGI